MMRTRGHREGGLKEKQETEHKIQIKDTIWRTPSLHAFQRGMMIRDNVWTFLEEGPSKREFIHDRKKGFSCSYFPPSNAFFCNIRSTGSLPTKESM